MSLFDIARNRTDWKFVESNGQIRLVMSPSQEYVLKSLSVSPMSFDALVKSTNRNSSIRINQALLSQLRAAGFIKVQKNKLNRTGLGSEIWSLDRRGYQWILEQEL